MKWTREKSETVLKNKFFTIKKETCRTSDNEIVPEYYIIEKEDSATIVALTEKNEVVLTEQYRHAVGKICIETPAGYFEPEDKNLKQTAQRELLEETGYKCEKIVFLGKSHPSIGSSNTSTHVFLGFNAKKIKKQSLETNEKIKIKIIPLEKTLKMIEDGKIESMPSINALLLAKNRLEEKSDNPTRHPCE